MPGHPPPRPSLHTCNNRGRLKFSKKDSSARMEQRTKTQTKKKQKKKTREWKFFPAFE
jgi:hypothetical protein